MKGSIFYSSIYYFCIGKRGVRKNAAACLPELIVSLCDSFLDKSLAPILKYKLYTTWWCLGESDKIKEIEYAFKSSAR